MIVIKLTYKNVTRRLPRQDIPSFNSLIQVCRNLFRIEKSQQVMITYIDSDNDIISIGSDSELIEAFRQLSPSSSALKLFIHIDNEEQVSTDEEEYEEEEENENEEEEREEDCIIQESNNEEKEEIIQKKQLSLLCSIENILSKLKGEARADDDEGNSSFNIEAKFKDFIELIKTNLLQFFNSINEKIIQPISNAAKVKFNELKSLINQVEMEIKKIKTRILKKLENSKEKMKKGCHGKTE